MATQSQNDKALNELFTRTNGHGEQIAVMKREVEEIKDGQTRLQTTMGTHGELLHAIKADLQSSRFPGLASIIQITVMAGSAIAMIVAAISYISANFVGSSLGPKITGIEKQNILLEYRLSQVEKKPDVATLMFRSQLR